MASGALLAATINIHRWLREDSATAYPVRQRRDRAIALELSATDDTARLLGWWHRVRPANADGSGLTAAAGSDSGLDMGSKVAQMRGFVTLVLLVVGCLGGLGVASIAFAYDGRHPVNLLMLLGVLVGLPSLLLIFTLLAVPGWLPGAEALRQFFAALSPGRWGGMWLDRTAGVNLFTGLQPPLPGSTFARWQLLTFMQWLAVGFFIGVLARAWLLVAFTDLTFGWSTTLAVPATTVHGWVAVLSAPWRAWLPAAAPDLNLVELSRFDRLDFVAPAAVGQLGEWWSFVLMTILCYGLLPRLGLLVAGTFMVGGATRRLLREDPEVQALLDRMNSPSVDFQSQEEEPGVPAADIELPPPPIAIAENTQAIIWNAAVGADVVRRWLPPADTRPVLSLDVVATSSDWDDSLRQVREGVEQLVIFTKGWEPPLLEFGDFLALLRARAGEAASLTVVPVAVDGHSVAAADRAVWAAALGRLGDRRLYVAAITEASS